MGCAGHNTKKVKMTASMRDDDMDDEYPRQGKGAWECACRKCRRKHEMMFWSIVLLLLVIIGLFMRQLKMI